MKKKSKKSKNLYTKKEITEMADRCYRRCWRCHRYEPISGMTVAGEELFRYSSSGCYEAHDLPWESGHWCPFWGNKNHPDAEILCSLTWENVKECTIKHFNNEPDIRQLILEANPEIAERIKYCDNSNESRNQYFNKSEHWTLIEIGDVKVYCETLRRYRYSLVDSRALYPGANEWIRPMMICFDPQTYKAQKFYLYDDDGLQISFACSPDENYHLDPDIFRFDEVKKEIVAVFISDDKVLETHRMLMYK